MKRKAQSLLTRHRQVRSRHFHNLTYQNLPALPMRLQTNNDEPKYAKGLSSYVTACAMEVDKIDSSVPTPRFFTRSHDIGAAPAA
jgi:hypothetical protein